MKKEFPYILITLSFLAIIFLLFINQIVPFIKDDSNVENRSKIEKPKFDISSLDKFPEAYNAFFLDNFQPRDAFISQYNKFNKDVFHNHILSRNYIRGNEDYLFTLSRFVENSNLFNATELELILKTLKTRNDSFRQNKRQMLYFVVPEKSSAIPNKLPFFFRPKTSNRSELAIEYIKKHSDVQIFYLKEAFTDKLQAEKLFLKYDTHWCNMGAFYAYKYMGEKVKDLFPQIEIFELNDFFIKDSLMKNGDIAKTLGMELVETINRFSFKHKGLVKKTESKNKYRSSEFFDYGVVTYQHVNRDLPSAVIVHDSFTSQLKPFLKNIFSSSLFLWDKWNYKPHYEIVNDFDPDLVIFIMTDGGFDKLLPKNTEKK